MLWYDRATGHTSLNLSAVTSVFFGLRIQLSISKNNVFFLVVHVYMVSL